MRDLAELTTLARAAAEAAAASIMAGYRSRPALEKKGRTDLVTEYDLRSQEILLERLAVAAPGVPIVAEEGADRGVPRGDLALFVDPLDGTTNFVHGHPFFCVSVGVLEDGAPAAGVVVAPALGLTWVAWRGEACLRNDEPCTVSGTARLSESLIATGFPYDRSRAPDDNFGSFIAVKRACRAVRRCGSAAIDLCLVADGTYDGYWERALRAWDVVAGAAAVLAAGGRITSLDGGAPVWDDGHLVASNALIHDALIERVSAYP